MPSFAIPLWLVLAAAAQPDPLSPPPPGSKPEVTQPSAPAAKSAAPAMKPVVPGTGKIPMPKNPSRPTTPTEPVPAVKPVPHAKPIGVAAPATRLDVPEEEVVADWTAKSKARRRGVRKSGPADRPEQPERKSAWTADRYAAVVPPGLTLAALRSQMAKTPAPEASTQPQEPSSDSVGDIEKAREALRQETARLEALLKTASSCAGSGMPIGDPMSPLSPTAIREAPTEQIDSVSKAMKGMKPEQAAAMVGRLDRALAAEILRRMKSTDAGAILGLLKPELAAELATQIATQKSSYGKDKKGAAK